MKQAVNSVLAILHLFLVPQSMSKDLEEGEIEEGELLGEVADISAGLDVSFITPGLFPGCLFLSAGHVLLK